MPTLTTPAVEEGLQVYTGLWRFFRHRRGISLGIVGTTVTQVRFPWQDDIPNYDHFYLGGGIYEISSAVATILTNAGYGAYIS